jgi:beta-glucosidase
VGALEFIMPKQERTRRDFLKNAGATAFGVSAARAVAAAETPARYEAHARSEAARRFPQGFLWGVATSAYQIEGAVHEDGRGPSIWDTFAHTPEKIWDKSNADVACDHYHRYKEDVQLMKALGAKAYRFSIAWPRVFPRGTGAPNPKGLDFYNRLIDELLANGIQPFATLYHWDLPQALQDRVGGWESRDTAKAFADYAGYVAQRITDRVHHIITINEFYSFVEGGYGVGFIAPGLKLPLGRLHQARHHAVLAHGLGLQAIRARAKPDTKVGPAENITIAVPVVETPEHIQAAERATREINAAYLTVMLEGRYTDAYLKAAGADAPKVTDDDLKAISSPVDFVGINVYTPQHFVRASEEDPGYVLVPFPKAYPHIAVERLRISPEALYWAPRHLARVWGVKDIYITENGCAARDVMTAEGRVDDIDRIMFLRNYLMHLQRATDDGVPVRGYFQWSLMDNFEWTAGYADRFGLHYVDYQTLKRTPKLSATFYRETIARNAVV